MDEKHTPEKWYSFYREDVGRYVIMGPGAIPVASVMSFHNPERVKDRAHLIAAAPETAAERDRLKAENAELVGALEVISLVLDTPMDSAESIKIARKSVRAALAKHRDKK